ncbi:MAG: DUF438 domain-containing protein [Promethearchaeota archaeon]
MIDKRKDDFKRVIEKIKAKDDFEDIKEFFSREIGLVSSSEFSYFENELLQEGISSSVIQEMRQIQLTLFRKAVEKQKPLESPGHPIHILMSEHVLLLEYVDELEELATSIVKGERESKPEFISRVRELIGFFVDSQSHYHREENAIFPVLEKHGLTGPPAAMWSEHQEIHQIEKEIFDLNSEDDTELAKNLKIMSDSVRALATKLADHFYKENNILFPASLRMFSENEWDTARHDFEDIGYASFTPRPKADVKNDKAAAVTDKGEVTFGSGTLTMEQLELIFNNLPVDTTFVDDQDKVQFFSESPARIFVRSRAVIGRSVQLCHPKASVDRVQQILDDFRAGKRDVAEFWINLKGRMVHIRYFALRNKDGEYQGCLEVSQDITDIKKIEGEKRLIDD